MYVWCFHISLITVFSLTLETDGLLRQLHGDSVYTASDTPVDCNYSVYAYGLWKT